MAVSLVMKTTGKAHCLRVTPPYRQRQRQFDGLRNRFHLRETSLAAGSVGYGGTVGAEQGAQCQLWLDAETLTASRLSTGGSWEQREGSVDALLCFVSATSSCNNNAGVHGIIA
jgi:hypothetical protein